MPGFSCFLREGDEIFHTYSILAGAPIMGNGDRLLDLTALGRQEGWEEPRGRVTPVRGGTPRSPADAPVRGEPGGTGVLVQPARRF